MNYLSSFLTHLIQHYSSRKLCSLTLLFQEHLSQHGSRFFSYECQRTFFDTSKPCIITIWFTMASSENSALTRMTFCSLQAKICPHLLGITQPKPHISSEIVTAMALESGHCGFQQVQAILHPVVNSAPILSGTPPKVSSCTPPLCASWKIAHLNHSSPTSSQSIRDTDQLISIPENSHRIAQTISMDQDVSTTPGSLRHAKGNEPAMKLTGSTPFVDQFSSFIFIHNKVSLGTGETLVWKAFSNH